MTQANPKPLVLLFESEHAAATSEAVGSLLNSPSFNLVVFTDRKDAVQYLREAPADASAVVLSDSVPLDERMAFMREFERDNPGVFHALPVLLLTDLKAIPSIHALKPRNVGLDCYGSAYPFGCYVN